MRVIPWLLPRIQGLVMILNVFIGNKWLQQQIPACRPVFTATHVSIGFIIIGIIFLAMGIAFTVVTAGVSSCALV